MATKKPAAPVAQLPKISLIKGFPFSDKDALKEWEEKIFKGKVDYAIGRSEDLSYVKAASDGAASALYYKVKIDARLRRPSIRWKWKVDKFPSKNGPESLSTKDQDDFAARVYVIFVAPFIMNSKVLEYIWAESLPAGTTGDSPYSKNIKLIVLQSGLAKDGWRIESRDILEDYVKMFGKAPERDIGAIAFMTNAEHTGSTADAMYDEIEIGYREGKAEGAR